MQTAIDTTQCPEVSACGDRAAQCSKRPSSVTSIRFLRRRTCSIHINIYMPSRNIGDSTKGVARLPAVHICTQGTVYDYLMATTASTITDLGVRCTYRNHCSELPNRLNRRTISSSWPSLAPDAESTFSDPLHPESESLIRMPAANFDPPSVGPSDPLSQQSRPARYAPGSHLSLSHRPLPDGPSRLPTMTLVRSGPRSLRRFILLAPSMARSGFTPSLVCRGSALPMRRSAARAGISSGGIICGSRAGRWGRGRGQEAAALATAAQGAVPQTLASSALVTLCAACSGLQKCPRDFPGLGMYQRLCGLTSTH